MKTPFSRALRLGFIGFIIALFGAALAFVLGDHFKPGSIFAYISFGIVAVGIGIGFFAIAWGWFDIFRSWRSR